MNDTHEDSVRKPRSTGQRAMTLIGAVCMAVASVLPQHAVAHEALLLLGLLLFAIEERRFYWRAMFVLLGLAFVFLWLHPILGKVGLLLALLLTVLSIAIVAVGVFEAVRERRKASN